MVKTGEYYDGIRHIEWKEQLGKTVRRDRQPGRKIILERNARLRNEARDAINHKFLGGLLRPTATIPEKDFEYLVKINPDLMSPDKEILARAWKKFLERDPVGGQYVINPPRLDKYIGGK